MPNDVLVKVQIQLPNVSFTRDVFNANALLVHQNRIEHSVRLRHDPRVQKPILNIEIEPLLPVAVKGFKW